MCTACPVRYFSKTAGKVAFISEKHLTSINRHMPWGRILSVSIKCLPKIAGKDAFLKITYDILPRAYLKHTRICPRKSTYRYDIRQFLMLFKITIQIGIIVTGNFSYSLLLNNTFPENYHINSDLLLFCIL